MQIFYLVTFREVVFAYFFSGTFEDKEITHVEGEVDPVRDLDIINEVNKAWFEFYFCEICFFLITYLFVFIILFSGIASKRRRVFLESF